MIKFFNLRYTHVIPRNIIEIKKNQKSFSAPCSICGLIFTNTSHLTLLHQNFYVNTFTSNIRNAKIMKMRGK